MSAGSARGQDQIQTINVDSGNIITVGGGGPSDEPQETECEQKLDYCVDVAKQIVKEAEEYIGALGQELQSQQLANQVLIQSVEKAKQAVEQQKKSNKTTSTLLAIAGGAAAGALLSTQQKDFSMLSGALAGGLVGGGTAALFQAVFEF